jgi:Uma2 family endonuclease
MTWKELCLDRRFQDLTFKIELNRQGQIIMSPTRNLHGYYKNKLACLLEKHILHGEIIVDCGVDTEDGTKGADVVWVSRERFAIIRDQFSCSVAPEICIEVLTPSNTLSEMMSKKDLFLKAGATEYWLCDEAGRVRFFSSTGPLSDSRLCPAFPAKVE